MNSWVIARNDDSERSLSQTGSTRKVIGTARGQGSPRAAQWELNAENYARVMPLIA
jgi:hypothetical protein